jgi:activator of HSP90 ATPase
VVSTPYKPVIVFDEEEEESDEEFEAVFFDDSEDDGDFDIVTSKEIDPKKASNIALIRTILTKINSLKHTGKDVTKIEEKMVFVLNCKDEDKKLILARSCLEVVDKLDKETDEEIFEETAQRYHALRARLLVLAKKGRNVNIFSSSVEDASQAISKSEFSEAERIIDEVMAKLDKM